MVVSFPGRMSFSTIADTSSAEIVEHCENDTRVLMEVYARLVDANVIRTIRKDGGVL